MTMGWTWSVLIACLAFIVLGLTYVVVLGALHR
jgi:hypothetical protein